MQTVLSTESRAGAWRLLEVFSIPGVAFELSLSWSAGSGNGARASITVPHSTRVCVFARSILVQARSLGEAENRVGVTVADGFIPTRNTFEVRGQTVGGAFGEGTLNPDLPGDADIDVDVETKGVVELPRPPFGQRVRVQLGSLSAVPGSAVELRGADGRLFATIPAELAATFGVPLGGAARMFLRTDGPTAFIATYTLCL